MCGRAISLANHQTYCCWVKVRTDSYPTNQWLSKVRLPPSAMCPNCYMQVVETIGHFATVCPKFKDAWTVAHDDSWEAVTAVLQRLVGPDSAWQFQWGTAVSSGPCCTLLRPVIQHLPAPAPPKR